jgi:hypothetical protein
MPASIYQFADTPTQAQRTPFEVLMLHAEAIEQGTEGLIEGRVTVRVQEVPGSADEPVGSKPTFSLHLQVPRLRNYLYRLYEVTPRDLDADYPVEVTIFLKSGPQPPYLAGDAGKLNHKLEEYAGTSAVTNILTNIRNQVQVMEDYQQGQQQ